MLVILLFNEINRVKKIAFYDFMFEDSIDNSIYLIITLFFIYFTKNLPLTPLKNYNGITIIVFKVIPLNIINFR